MTDSKQDDNQPLDGFNAWILREFGPDAAPEQVVARFKAAWDKGIQELDARLAAASAPVLYEINFTNCQTPWFTVPAAVLPDFIETNLAGFEYRALYRGLTRGPGTITSSGKTGQVEAQASELKSLVRQLRKLAGEATPGPWAVHSHDLDENGVTEVHFLAQEGVRSEEEIFAETLGGNHDSAANAAYIAAANPDAILKLCEALEEFLK